MNDVLLQEFQILHVMVELLRQTQYQIFVWFVLPQDGLNSTQKAWQALIAITETRA
jgi:hypothetical protein